MLIKLLKMFNFRQFKGTTKVEFSCNPDNNVTIILGDNTYGKTTLLQAFNWCFYGKALFDMQPDMLLNLEIADEMNRGYSEDVEVEISLIHDGTEYTIIRTQKYISYGSSVKAEGASQCKVSYKQPDGQTEPVKASQVKNVINNILPEDLSTYFFFDTERVNSISTRKDVAEAVKGLLGLTSIGNAIEHLGSKNRKNSVIGRLFNSLDISGDKTAQELRKKIQTAEDKSNELEDKIKECEKQITLYELEKENFEKILRSNQNTSDLQKQKDHYEKLCKAERSFLNNDIEEYLKSFNKQSLSFFSQPLIKKTSLYLKEVKVDDKGVRDLTKPTIIELINRGRCICGSEVCEGNTAYTNLMEELAYVPPESIGNTVRNYKEKLIELEKNAQDTYQTLEQKYGKILKREDMIQEWEDTLSEISGKLIGKEDMSKYESKIIEFKQTIKELLSKRDNLKGYEIALKSDIDHDQKTLDGLSIKTSKNEFIQHQILYAEKIVEWLSITYKERECTIREALESKVNEIFNKMYHGKRKVIIDEKYHTQLLSSVADREIETGESEGLSRVKNFAFISGLVTLAKNKIIGDKKEKELNLSSEPYPLIMDAPFSNADEIHIANISKVLPETAEQVIMFVMQKDWNYAEKVMSARVGKQYYLTKISETYTKIMA